MTLLIFILPLCLVVAIVHSATRKDSPKDILVASLSFFLKLMAAFLVIGAVLYVLTQFF
jgi:hypothetical protein